MEKVDLSRNTSLEDAVAIVSLHYDSIHRVLMDTYQETKRFKDQQLERGIICEMTPKTKGSIMSDALNHYLNSAFSGTDNISVLCLNNVPGLLIDDKVFIKFNKMDEAHKPSIQQRKWYKAITNQGYKIKGLAPDIIKMWAGIIPLDSQWSSVARCALVYYEGGTVAWATDLQDRTVKQLSIDITPPNTKRRTKPKQQGGDQKEQTGTNNV